MVSSEARGGERERVVVVIGSPLEEEHAAAIAAAYPDAVAVVHRPDLLPPARFVADHGGDPAWRRTPAQEAAWRGVLRRAEVLWDFPHGESVNPLELAPGLRWVQTTSAGVGPTVERLGLRQSEVLVTTASGIHARPLAEFVFAVLLFHVKRLAFLQVEQRTHRWQRYCGSGLDGQTMAIIGPGRIGREVARLARCFGMTIWAMARQHDPARAATLGVDRLFARDALPEMLAGADCLVLCAPQTAETVGLIGAAELAAVKPGAVLINIARGAMIDEEALVAAVADGRVGFAALDVARTEPLPADSLLWDLPNVLISPHSASTVETENATLTERFIANLGHYLRGEPELMEPVLDKERLY